MGLIFCHQHLYASFEEESGFFQFATSTTSNDVEEIQKFLDQAIDARFFKFF
jgi:DNA ligase-1